MLTIGPPAMAQMGSGHMMTPGGHGAPGGAWGSYQATPEQEAAVREIMDKYQPSISATAERIWAARAELNGELARDKIDRNTVKALAKKIGDMLGQSYEMQVEMLMEMRARGLSYYGMGMMHGGLMGGGLMGGGMMGGGMMDGGMTGMMPGGWQGPGRGADGRRYAPQQP
jgi:zinc resistance-associated protein